MAIKNSAISIPAMRELRSPQSLQYCRQVWRDTVRTLYVCCAVLYCTGPWTRDWTKIVSFVKRNRNQLQCKAFTKVCLIVLHMLHCIALWESQNAHLMLCGSGLDREGLIVEARFGRYISCL